MAGLRGLGEGPRRPPRSELIKFVGAKGRSSLSRDQEVPVAEQIRSRKGEVLSSVGRESRSRAPIKRPATSSGLRITNLQEKKQISFIKKKGSAGPSRRILPYTDPTVKEMDLWMDCGSTSYYNVWPALNQEVTSANSIICGTTRMKAVVFQRSQAASYEGGTHH